MESKAMDKTGPTITTVPHRDAKNADVVIKVGDFPTDANPIPPSMQANKDAEAKKAAKGKAKSGTSAAKKQAKEPKAPQEKEAPETKAAKEDTEPEQKRRMIVLVSRRTSRIRFCRSTITLRLYGAFMQFFTVMNLSLFFLMMYLTRKPDILGLLNKIDAAVITLLKNDLIFPVSLFMATLMAQLYFFICIVYQLRRRRRR